jgi:peroxiredoxin
VKPRVVVVALLLVVIAWIAWRSQLWTVSRPGAAPEPLALREPKARTAVQFDATIPAVPYGSERLASGRGVLLVHYWAPWEHASRQQVALLDSLRELPELEGLRVVVVCFDPFPSVARFVARQRWQISVLIDGRGRLRQVLPCPSVPYTYVLDGSGRIAVAQPGEVDWWAPGTRAALMALLQESEHEALPPADLVRPKGRTGSPS